ncbi:MAG TPA: cell division protein ZapA [Gammaproteobacteria bacterium]|nr:cell division protein ZapA [Gammaproteobacteria bacterium]
MSKPAAVKLKILGTEIQVACKPDEEDALLKAARYVEKEMQTVKSRGGNPSSEKIALITAMNMANELLSLRAGSDELESASSLLDEMQRSLKKVLQ